MISALPISKPILYIDMDNVLVDFQSGINNLSEYEKREYSSDCKEMGRCIELFVLDCE